MESSSSTSAAAAVARAKAEAAKARLRFADEEERIKVEKAKLEAKIYKMVLERETAAAVAEAEALEAAVDTSVHSKHEPQLEAAPADVMQRTSEYVEQQNKSTHSLRISIKCRATPFRELKISSNIDNTSVNKFLLDQDCVWQFNPPHASHMGGSWERMIGLARRILDAMFQQLGPSALTHEILSTLMAEVAAKVNARPLIPVSTDPEDPFILTPTLEG
ncbi:hypothetical protein QQF64_001176 [Cirrhinus molitorella]|uniref:Uncharacterized protein n=1 Tax=Cirrhinus molitorella TaxID=172907 RepID=A0ABR3NZA2_9TELE